MPDSTFHQLNCHTCRLESTPRTGFPLRAKCEFLASAHTPQPSTNCITDPAQFSYGAGTSVVQSIVVGLSFRLDNALAAISSKPRNAHAHVLQQAPGLRLGASAQLATGGSKREPAASTPAAAGTVTDAIPHDSCSIDSRRSRNLHEVRQAASTKASARAVRSALCFLGRQQARNGWSKGEERGADAVMGCDESGYVPLEDVKQRWAGWGREGWTERPAPIEWTGAREKRNRTGVEPLLGRGRV